ncbi:MAG: Tm-1-like ATP-binding domain-containing protein [Desulfobacterales bacterium]|nr:Tm-1-like ATP-binding domain-containing protein [Desulfobacterales bacterium]
MKKNASIAVLGTFDSKGEEHRFLQKQIGQRGQPALTIHVGVKAPSPFPVDMDLFAEIKKDGVDATGSRDKAIEAMILKARKRVGELYAAGAISGVISAGGGSGTHLCTRIMHVLPVGIPKVMVSTVASRDMAQIVGTKDITMMHSVVDLLGVNSISGSVLDRAAAAICGMVQSRWQPGKMKKRIALTFFGFITAAAENVKKYLEKSGYEVIPFHANGTGGMAMEELSAEGYFQGILDLATHELADALKGGYCGGIGPGRLEPAAGTHLPRLVVPGGLDCAVLEFTRDTIPLAYKDRKIFFYDFRSAVRLTDDETRILAKQLAAKVNKSVPDIKILIPLRGWSEADREGGPLFAPDATRLFIHTLKEDINPGIDITEVDHHINERPFARIAADMMDAMIKNQDTKMTA